LSEPATMIRTAPASLDGLPPESATEKRKLAVVISHPIQHFVPLFQRLARSPEVDLKVFYCCDWGVREYADPGFGRSFAWDIPLLDGYKFEFLPIRSRPRSLGFWDVDNPEVTSRIEHFAPDAVWVHGYSQRTSWRVLRWARGRAKVLYFGDSELLSQRGRMARVLKRIVLPRFFRRCDAFLTIGDRNEEYYRHYNVPLEKLHRGSFPIDVERFHREISGLDDSDRKRLRAELGLPPDALVVLFVGKLIDIKRPFDFLEALARLRRATSQVSGLIVGSGPLEATVKSQIAALGLSDCVKLTGFVNQSRIPQVLWAGDVLAICSEKDPHPLAVSEAMAVGNAVVASDRVGCVGPTDAARTGRNALTYPCGDVAALAGHLRTLANDPLLLRAMQHASRDLAWTQDVSVADAAVLRALRVTCPPKSTTGRRSPGGDQ
jgi:glycosyltransferase involved in cell wall biosynthesis